MASGKFGLNTYVQSAVNLGTFDIDGDSLIKLTVTNASPTNKFEVRGKIVGQSNFTLIDSVLGNGTKSINVSRFDFLEIACTTFSSLTTYVQIDGSGFGNTGTKGMTQVITPTGAMDEVDFLTFTSSDNSVQISGIAPGTVDIKVPAVVLNNSFGTATVPTGTNVVAGSPGASLNFTVDNYLDVVGTNATSTLQIKAKALITDNLSKVEKFTLDNSNIVGKLIILQAAPAVPAKVKLSVGGVEQEVGVDFSVSGNLISWSGLGLEGILTVGDIVTVTYN